MVSLLALTETYGIMAMAATLWLPPIYDKPDAVHIFGREPLNPIGTFVGLDPLVDYLAVHTVVQRLLARHGLVHLPRHSGVSQLMAVGADHHPNRHPARLVGGKIEKYPGAFGAAKISRSIFHRALGTPWLGVTGLWGCFPTMGALWLGVMGPY